MEDQELAAIRAARIQQLQQQGSSASTGQPSLPSTEDDGEAAAKRASEDEMRRNLLAAVLEPAARERLARIALVRPERSSQIENILLQMVRSGQLRERRVTEEQLIGLLEQAEDAQSKAKESKITFQRRRDPDDSDDDFDFDV